MHVTVLYVALQAQTYAISFCEEPVGWIEAIEE